MKLHELVLKKNSFGARVVFAGSWNLALNTSQVFVRLLSNLILARLLLPEAFGMMAIATTVMVAATLMTDVGVHRSIIREHDGGEDKFLRVAWTVKVLRGGLVAAFLILAALGLMIVPAGFFSVDSVYSQPEVPSLVAIAALVPILTGFSSTSKELVVRNLQVRKLTIIRLASQICAMFAMIAFAYVSPTVWALVLGMLVNELLLCIFSHLLLPGPRMAFSWDAEMVSRLWQFGKWIIGSSVVTFFGSHTDKLIFGWVLGAASFGLYSIAQVWVEAGRSLVVRLAEGVVFPAIAEIVRVRPKELQKAYFKLQLVMDLISVLGFAATMVLGPYLVGVLYPEGYVPVGHYLHLMAPAFLMVRYEVLSNLILNMGDSFALFLISLLKALGMVTLIPSVYIVWGMDAAILAATVSPSFAVLYILVKTHKIIGVWQTFFGCAFFIFTLSVSYAIYQLN